MFKNESNYLCIKYSDKGLRHYYYYYSKKGVEINNLNVHNAYVYHAYFNYYELHTEISLNNYR